MRRNQKIHAIAIASICVLVTIIYVVAMPSHTADPQAHGDRAIEIYGATWGENCNGFIAKANRERQSYKSSTAATPGEPIKTLAPVQMDNALTPVSNACNGKISCDIQPSSESLGVEPAEDCFKQLVVRYRCFEYDRVWSVTSDQNKLLTIDCNASPAAAPKQ